MATDAVLEAADRLYALPLPEFTPARDRLAKELKSEDREASERVKKLKKPSVAAWAVNLLVRRESEQVDQVLNVGEALRQAQADLDAAQLRELTKQRRQLTSAITKQARSLASDAGQKLTQAVADQVEATLTAAMVDEGAARAVRSGLLIGALEATGVGEVDVAPHLAVPDALGFSATPVEEEEPAPPDLKVVPDPDADAKKLAAAEEELAEAEAEVERVTEALAASQRDVEALEARALQVQAEIDELRRRLGELEESAEDIDDQLSDAHEAVEGARTEVATADAARAKAAKKVAKLKG